MSPVTAAGRRDHPGRRFGEYLAVMCGLIRRYGASEPTVAHALLRLLGNCAAVAADDPERCAAIEEQARIIVADAEREVAQPIDLAFTHAEAESVLQTVAGAAPVTLHPAARRTSRPPLRRRGNTAQTGTRSATGGRAAARMSRSAGAWTGSPQRSHGPLG